MSPVEPASVSPMPTDTRESVDPAPSGSSFASDVTNRHSVTEGQGPSGRTGRGRGLWIGLGLLVLGGAGWFLFGAPTAGGDPETTAAAPSTPVERPHAPPTPVATARPEAVKGFSLSRRFTGEVRPRRQLALGFPLGGRVESLAVDEGDAVTADQPIATLDTRRYDAEKVRLEARQSELTAQLEEMRAGPRDEVIAAARRRVEQLEAREALLEKQLERRRELRETKRVTQEEVDEFETRLSETRASMAAARQQLLELVNGTRAETIRAQEARLAQVAAALSRLQVDIEDSILAAPFAGRVLRRHVERRAVVSPGQPVYTLSEVGHLEAWIGLSPRDALALPLDSEHTLVIEGRSYKATLQARLPDTDAATRTQTAVFRLPAGAGDRVVPGQIARLELERFEAEPGLWVPTSALTKGVRGLWSVYSLVPIDGDPDKAFRVVREHVEVLHTEGERTLIRGTIAPDRQIVVGETRKVVPGQRARPVAKGR